MDTKIFSKICHRIDQLQPEAIELMKAIVSIPALGPTNNGKGETEKAEFLIGYLRSVGLSAIEEYPAPDPRVVGGLRPNIVVRVNGRNRSKTVWIMAHLDVVPEGDLSKWETKPFEAVLKNGKIYGRGTEDNHQGLVSGLLTAKAFIDAGIQPEVNLALLFVSDEETGSVYGLDYVLKNHPELFGTDDLFIIPDAGEPDSRMIEVAEKSIIWFKFKISGKQVHASMPDKGVNAHKAGAHLIVKLDELYSLFNKVNPVFDPPVSTFEPTKKNANVPNVNTVPGEDVFYLDCRVLPEYELSEVTTQVRRMADEIEQKFKVQIEISTEQNEQAAPATPVDAEIVRKLTSGIQEIYKVTAQPKGIGGGTVAAIFRRAGFNAAVWSTIDDLAHQPNEYCVIRNMVNDAKVFAHVLLENK